MTDENNQIKFFLYENWARTKIGQHTVPVVCLLCLYCFSELLEAVWGDILFNGRSDVLSRTGFTLT